MRDRRFDLEWAGDGRALIRWQGRIVRVLTGAKAKWLRTNCEGASAEQVQLLLARCTGNFKRGNERR